MSGTTSVFTVALYEGQKPLRGQFAGDERIRNMYASSSFVLIIISFLLDRQMFSPNQIDAGQRTNMTTS